MTEGCILTGPGQRPRRGGLEQQLTTMTYTNRIRKRRTCDLGLIQVALFTALFLHGCSMLSAPYVERHEVNNLTVVFLDTTSLRAEWTRVTGDAAVRFIRRMGGGKPPVEVRTMQGFYDFRTNTLYCTKWDFHVCGHELHHALLGHFHSPR